MDDPFLPVDGGSGGTTAWVMKEAAVACKKLVLGAAASLLETTPEELDARAKTRGFADGFRQTGLRQTPGTWGRKRQNDRMRRSSMVFALGLLMRELRSSLRDATISLILPRVASGPLFL